MNPSPATTAPSPGRLPFQPLLDVLPIDWTLARSDVVGPGPIAQAATLLGVTRRTVHRYRNSGLDHWTADRLAITAGCHPLTVWGQDWIHAINLNQTPSRGEDQVASRPPPTR